MNSPWDGSLLFLCLVGIFVSWLITIQFWSIMPAIRRRDPELDEPALPCKLSVIIPARNEEQDLAASLETVLGQQHVDLEVIVINDHSTDRTGEIAESFARVDARVTVLHDPELQPGWLGKVNAMQYGLTHTSHELLLFADADILHAPHCLATGVRLLERQQLDFVSLFPLIRCVSLIENVNVPMYLGGFVQLWREALRPGSQRAFGAGAFLLVRAEILRAIGGLAAIKTEMLDDVMLASRIKQQGYRVGFWCAPHLLEVRLFKGNRHAFWGMTKNVLAALDNKIWMAPIGALLPSLIFWTPWISMIRGALNHDHLLLFVGGVTYCNQYLLLLPSREIIAFHRGKLLFFPLVSIVAICTFAKALYFHAIHGAVLWRGRSIRVDS